MESNNTVEFIYLVMLLFVLPWGGVALHLWALLNTIRHRFDGSQKRLWIFMNLCVPIIGPFLYIFIGRKQRKERIQAESQASANPGIASSESEVPSPASSTFKEGPARWIQPIVLSLLLVVFEEQGVLTFLIGLFLLFVYLPRSFGERYKNCRRERLIRCAIYLSAVAMAFGLRIYNTSLANERAATVIAAVEVYKTKTGAYPERLEQLLPGFIPAIPSKAKLTLMDGGFRYFSTSGRHTLSYVSFPPFGRRVYDFESGKWRDTD